MRDCVRVRVRVVVCVFVGYLYDAKQLSGGGFGVGSENAHSLHFPAGWGRSPAREAQVRANTDTDA